MMGLRETINNTKVTATSKKVLEKKNWLKMPRDWFDDSVEWIISLRLMTDKEKIFMIFNVRKELKFDFPRRREIRAANGDYDGISDFLMYIE